MLKKNANYNSSCVEIIKEPNEVVTAVIITAVFDC